MNNKKGLLRFLGVNAVEPNYYFVITDSDHSGKYRENKMKIYHG